VSVIRRIALMAAVVGIAGGVANLRAQTVLGDPKDAGRTFASNCSACHKSPQGLAKSGQVAGFLRQHYTTGPEMSAAMAAYLVAAGAAPASKKGAETAAAKGKKDGKQEPKQQLSAAPPTAGTDGTQKQTLRGKQRQQKGTESQTSSVQQPDHAVQRPAESPTGERKQAGTPQAAASQTAAAPAVAAPATPATPSTPAAPEMMVLDVPLPAMPDAPPPELSQSAFSSSPLP